MSKNHQTPAAPVDTAPAVVTAPDFVVDTAGVATIVTTGVDIETNNAPQVNVYAAIASVVEDRGGGVTVETFVGEQPDVNFAEAV